MIPPQNDVSDFIQPRLLGELIDPRAQTKRGIACYGLAVDAAGIMVAGIFGGRQVMLDRFYPEVDLGLPACVQIAGKSIDFRLAGGQAYKLYPSAYPEQTGTFPLFLMPELLANTPLTRLGDHAHFYTLGHPGAAHPHLDIWARRMQDLYALPLDPGWYPHLWELLLTEGWAAPVTVYGGFGPIWDVFIGQEDWRDLVLRQVKGGALT